VIISKEMINVNYFLILLKNMSMLSMELHSDLFAFMCYKEKCLPSYIMSTEVSEENIKGKYFSYFVV
jgi:hypothetical protein